MPRDTSADWPPREAPGRPVGILRTPSTLAGKFPKLRRILMLLSAHHMQVIYLDISWVGSHLCNADLQLGLHKWHLLGVSRWFSLHSDKSDVNQQ